MVDKRPIIICHLYAHEMNIYGDTGNIQAFKYRLEKRGYNTEIIKIGIGEKLPSDIDILFAGGGQDSGQLKIQEDLKGKKSSLLSAQENGVVMLTICGMYQLFGNEFSGDDFSIEGVGIFDMVTKAGFDRLIGNVVIDSQWGKMAGFENHGGRTYLSEGIQPLGTTTKGAGNNDEDKTEGAIVGNSFGTYLHGPILPKNPVFADELISRALERKYGKSTQLGQIDDSYSHKASAIARKLPR